MVGILILSAVGAFVLANGVLMLFRPVLWLDLHNRLNTKLAMGRSPWIWFNTGTERQGNRLWSDRVAGIPAICLGLFIIIEALKSLLRLLSGEGVTSKGGPAAESVKRGTAEVWQMRLVGAAFAAAAAALGLVLVVSPKKGMRMLGAGRYYEARIPEYLWRVLGLGFLAGGCAALCFSLG